MVIDVSLSRPVGWSPTLEAKEKKEAGVLFILHFRRPADLRFFVVE